MEVPHTKLLIDGLVNNNNNNSKFEIPAHLNPYKTKIGGRLIRTMGIRSQISRITHVVLVRVVMRDTVVGDIVTMRGTMTPEIPVIPTTIFRSRVTVIRRGVSLILHREVN